MADGPPAQDGEWPRPPYAWIITPLLIFTLIAIAATFFQLRRRRAARRPATAANPYGCADSTHRPSQDLEAGRNTRTRRWGGMRRREEPVEGLNELGEAPPPYEPGAKKENVELADVAGPPVYGEDEGDASGVRTPPAAVTHDSSR